MQRLAKIVLLPALLLACASAGLWHVQGQRDNKSNQSIKAANASVRRFGNVTIQIKEGAFALKHVALTRTVTSAILKGEIVNKTNRYLDQATFEIKAFDRNGKLLNGVEEKTIFVAHQLKANASTSINSNYGVWLQGIPLDAIARIEISETGDEPMASFPIRAIPFASHVVAWKEYSEIEE